MDYNPYAAPEAPGPYEPGRPVIDGAPQPWTVGDVISHGWEMVKRHWVVLVFAPLLAGFVPGVLYQIPTFVAQAAHLHPESAGYWVVMGVFFIIAWLVQIFFQVGLTRIYLSAARGQEPVFQDLWGGASRYLPFMGMSLLAGLAITLGMVLLIVPGIILSLGLCLASFYCVDAKMSAVESLVASWRATEGHKGQIFVFGLAAMGVALLGYLACCVGVYVAMPVIMVAFATIYVRLSGRGMPEGPPPGSYGPPPGVPPGYEPPAGTSAQGPPGF